MRPEPQGLGARPKFVRTSLFLALCLPAVVSAQIVGPEHISLALGVLRAGPGLTLTLTGEEATTLRRQSFRVNFYYEPPAESEHPRAAIWSYREGKLERHLMADGTDFVRYDPVMNQYSSVGYRDLAGLSSLLQATARGMMAIPVHLFTDMISTDTWRPWLRRADIDTSTPLQLRYSTPNDFVSFVFEGPLAPEAPVLKEMRGQEVRGGLTTTWRMAIVPGVPSTLRFAFAPPRGAKPVSAPSSVRSPE
ncbi:MAG: hypothetical protein IT206_09600 [Fimbriimonadaceae bacterium]|nr:hypothetical protein [Fimbriimonadaceae bacterium]